MEIVALKQITKKNSPLMYRKEFTGTAVLNFGNNRGIEKKIEFVFESTALGVPDIHINVLEDIDYPLVPVIKSINLALFPVRPTAKYLPLLLNLVSLINAAQYIKL